VLLQIAHDDQLGMLGTQKGVKTYEGEIIDSMSYKVDARKCEKFGNNPRIHPD
jgi:hypothetical protein